MPKRLKKKITRQERILSTLADLTYATSAQINAVAGLGGDRNVRRVLFEMESDRLIGSVRRESKVYYLAGKGGDLIGRENPRLKRSQIDHAVLRNDLYLRLGLPANWKKEVEIKLNSNKVLVADAAFTEGDRMYFIEIDVNSSMQANNSKIKRYAEIVRNLNCPSTIIWYTLIEARKKILRENCVKVGVDCRIY